jgi:hypothetical protein
MITTNPQPDINYHGKGGTIRSLIKIGRFELQLLITDKTCWVCKKKNCKKDKLK